MLHLSVAKCASSVLLGLFELFLCENGVRNVWTWTIKDNLERPKLFRLSFASSQC